MKSLSERETTVEHYYCKKKYQLSNVKQNKNAFVNYSTSPRQAIIQLLHMIL